MSSIRFIVVKSQSMRNLVSLRLIGPKGEALEFSIQEEMTKAGFKVGDLVELKLVNHNPGKEP